jgi:hypothetical protein
LAKRKQHIDDFFKEHLKGQTQTLDGSEWDRLSKELAPKKKRRFWWFLLLIPIGISAIYFVNQGATGGQENENQPVDMQSPSSSGQEEMGNQAEEDAIQQAEEERTPFEDHKKSDNDTEDQGETVFTEEGEVNLPMFSNPSPAIDALASRSTKEGEWMPWNGDSALLHTMVAIALKDIPYNFLATLDTLQSKTPPQTENTKPIEGPPLSPSEYWRIGLTYSGLYADQQLTGAQLDGDYDLTDLREQNENPSLSSAFSLQLETNVKGWTVGSGLMYQVKRQSLGSNGEIHLIRYDTIPFVDLNGDTTWLRWNFRDSSASTSDNRSPAYYSIGLPIALSRQFAISQRMTLMAGIQSEVHYTFMTGGELLRSPYKIGSNTAASVQNWQVSSGVLLGVHYRVQPQWELRMQTGWKTDLLNMSTTSGLGQKFEMYGLRLGLFYLIEK